MFLLGIFIHFTFLFSIFDIYFKSPVVNNVIPYYPHHEALADRLVLFIVDGLRAESFVNYTTMPYLRSVANSNGRWGISNTRVPTESRPGHVAVIAGFYEDPSAIAKGWKENPVDFDSFFNQTTYTWCWGTYDIVEIFTKGSASNHIFVNKFDPYDQTFSTNKNTTHLDAWVFDSVKQFFDKAKSDVDVHRKLHEKKTALFLHLLGTDTSGHTHKPKTENFLTTVRFVDNGIKEMVNIIQEFYKDDKTTFLMTSDHGMTDWGSHGSGDDHETKTPYVIWGAGVEKVQGVYMDPGTLNMSLSHRLDINQADLTPLMSTILSIPVPVNSIGRLPTEILHMSLSSRAKAIYSNSRQLASQYEKKRLDIETFAIKVLYYPYEPFSEKKYKEIIDFAEILLQEQKYDKLILLSEDIINLSLKGLDYYQNYYQIPLLILVTLSFMGWIVILLKTLIEQKLNTESVSSTMRAYNLFDGNGKSQIANLIFIILGLVMFYIVNVQNLPSQYYVYFLTPVLLWWYAMSSLAVWTQIMKQLSRSRGFYKIWLEIICYTVGSMALGLSFTYRWMLSIPLLGMGIWPLISSTRDNLSFTLLANWLAGCVLLSLFSFMPVVGKDAFIELVIAAGMSWLLVMIIYTWKVLMPLFHNNDEGKKEILLTGIQIFFLFVSMQNIFVQSRRFDRGTPVSHMYQVAAWVIAVTSLLLPLASSRRLVCRLFTINTSLLNFYLLLSVSHEGLFMVALIYNVTCWIFIEFRLVQKKNVKITEYLFQKDSFGETSHSFTSIERSISNADFRRAFFFVIYIILAFFGTGNIASLNSFEVRWVTCFITSFQPFIITGLILLKTLAPFLFVACGFRTVQHLTKAPSGYLHIIVLIYSNIMGIQLLFYVKNTGSWLEIGTSISQFVIVQVITLFIVLINQIAKILTDINLYNFTYIFTGKKKYV